MDLFRKIYLISFLSISLQAAEITFHNNTAYRMRYKQGQNTLIINVNGRRAIAVQDRDSFILVGAVSATYTLSRKTQSVVDFKREHPFSLDSFKVAVFGGYELQVNEDGLNLVEVQAAANRQ